MRENSAIVARSTQFRVVCCGSRRKRRENMTGRSKLTQESTEKKRPGVSLRKGLMYSDGSELREDDSEASVVIAYFKLITNSLGGDEYNSFLKVMVDFQAGRIDLEGVENQLKVLFHGHPDLILGLNRFLPNDIEIILPTESDKPEKMKTNQQVSQGHVSLKQEICSKKTNREKSEQDNEAPQVADNGGDRNPERMPLEQTNLQQKTKRGKTRHENESHQAAESANYTTVERMPSTTQNVVEWHEVELKMYQLEGRNPASSVHMWPVHPFTAAEFVITNQMPISHSKPANYVRTDAAKDVHVNKRNKFTPANPLLQDTKMPSLITDAHEKQRLFSLCLNQSRLVEDPIWHEQKRKTTNPWTPEEKQLFLQKYNVFRKLFSKIASFLENKTTADCVEYYYLNKKSGDLKMVRRRQKLQQNRESDR